MDSFICGFAYGLTSVVVGQPLDTIKTTMQTTGAMSSVDTAKDIFHREGVRGLYRGGLPMILGGALIRSAQFGVYNSSLSFFRSQLGPVTQEKRVFGVFDYQVILAGFSGGIGRGVVEAPFEFIKVRRQVNKPWQWAEVFHGSGATMLRGLGSFLTGAICSNMAWLTIWPLDVVKSQIQAGTASNPKASYGEILRGVVKNRLIFRGLLPGLTRSTIANGLSMVAYDKTDAFLKSRYHKN